MAVAARAGEATGLWSWRRLTAREQADAGGERAEALEDAQQDVQEALERVAAAAALELAERMAAAAVPTAGEVIEVGEDIVEASEDVLDDVEAHVPAGSVVGQVIDLALVPGRFGLRIATTVLRGDSRAG